MPEISFSILGGDGAQHPLLSPLVVPSGRRHRAGRGRGRARLAGVHRGGHVLHHQHRPPTTTQPETTIGPTSKPYDILWEELASEASTLRSEGFEAPPVWRIEWAFDCSNFGDYGGGNFKITGDGDFQQEIQIEKRAVRHNGTTPVRRGGFGHLYIETVCEQWTVRALSG